MLSKNCINLTNEEKNGLIFDIPKYVSRIQWGKVNYNNNSSDLSSFHKKRGDDLFQDIKNFVEINSIYTRKIKKNKLNSTRKR